MALPSRRFPHLYGWFRHRNTLGVLTDRKRRLQKEGGPRRGRLGCRFSKQCLAEHRHHAEEVGRAATAAAATTTAAAAAARCARLVIRRFTRRGQPGGQDFRLQRLVLQRIEVAGLRITAGSLPAGDHSAGVLVELASGLDVEAEARQAALYVAALALVEAELVFAHLGAFI